MSAHPLPDCLLVWLNPYLVYGEGDGGENEDFICEQGWADWKWGGINEDVVKIIRRRKP